MAAPKLIEETMRPVSGDLLSRLPKIHDSHDLWPRLLAKLELIDRSGRGLRLSQTALAVDAAIAGQGVALVSRFLVSGDLAVGNLQEIATSPNIGAQDFYLLTLRRPTPNAAIGTVASWLTSHAQQTK